MISIRLPDDITKRLNSLAKKTGRSKSWYAREAIVEHLEKLEDVYISRHRLETHARKWPLENLENGIDLDD